MNKLLASLIIISPLVATAAVSTKPTGQTLSKNDIAILSSMISTFDLTNDSHGLKIQIRNAYGQEKVELLPEKNEEYQEYSKYSFINPHQKSGKLDLFVFEKVKPSLQDERDLNSSEDLTDLRFDLQVLMDFESKKTIKTKVVVFYKELLIAEGAVENNTAIKIVNDLGKQIKDGKIHEIRVSQNLMGSYKREMDLEVKYIQGNKLLRQRLSLNLQNVKQTPIPKIDDEFEEIEEDLNIDPNNEEGISNETNNTHS